MLETWLRIQESNAQSLANDAQVRELATQLIATRQSSANEAARDSNLETISASPSNLSALRNQLTKELTAGMAAPNFIRYILVDRGLRAPPASNPDFLGRTLTEYEGFLRRGLEGKLTVTTPFSSIVAIDDLRGRRRTGVPTMFAVAPVYDANQNVIAALA